MNFLTFLTDAAEALISKLECRFTLEEMELKILPKIPSVEQIDIDILLMHHRVGMSFHSILCNYLKVLKELQLPTCPFKQAVSCHCVALDRIDIQHFIDNIIGHQQALSDLSGIPLPEAAENIEDALLSTSYFFPFHILEPIIHDPSKFTEIMKIALQFNIKNFKQSLLEMYNLLKSVRLPKFTKIAVAEVILDYFVSDFKKKNIRTETENFQFLENCKLIISSGPKSLSINQKLASKFQQPADREGHNVLNDLPKLNYTMDLDLSFDDDGIEIEFPRLEHISNELRMMTVQSSTTSIFVALSRAMKWLRAAITYEGLSAGADEIFQFFVASLVNAKLLAMQTLLTHLEKFIVSDLITPQFSYLKTQLQSAVEFIQTRQVPVPPVLIFPFLDPPTADLEREGDDHVILRRFAVFSYPSTSGKTISALLMYTGCSGDTAIGYKFRPGPGFHSASGVSDRLQAIPTVHGSIMLIDSEEASAAGMIRVSDGDLASHVGDVALVSNLMRLIPFRVVGASTEMLPRLLGAFAQEWRVPPQEAAARARALVREMQGRLGVTGDADGVIGPETVAAIRRRIPNLRGDFYINQKIYSIIAK